MRIVRQASEAEVVAVFLCAELQSDRWRTRLQALLEEDGVDEAVVLAPRLDDADEVAYRERLLERHRAWLRREGLFLGLPRRIDWRRAALTPDEVLAIRYINWGWWLEVSGDTRSPVEAAARIRAGHVPGSDPEWHEPIAARLRGADPPAELIVVGPPGGSPLVALEGHVRLTSYALYPQYLPHELEVFVGTAPDIERWSEF